MDQRSIRADLHHVGIADRRYQQQRRDRTDHSGRGVEKRRESIMGTHSGEINVKNYTVNPDAVADAIVQRLIAGTRKPS